MKLSVIVPVYKGTRTLKRCLESIAASCFKGCEVLVVDQDSSGDSHRIAHPFGFQVYRWRDQLGLWVGRNLGAALSSGEILVFVDADICVREKTLSRIADHFAQDRHGVVVGIIAPRSLEDNFVSHYKDGWIHQSYEHFSEEISWISASLMAVERKVFFQTGGFGGHLSPLLEGRDTEFGKRVIRAGFPIFLDRGLEVDHHRRFSVGQVLGDGFRGSAVNLQLALATRKVEGSMRREVLDHLPAHHVAGIIFACLTAASLFISPWAPWALRWALLWMLLYVLANVRLLRFYRDTFGGIFAWRALPLSLVNHLASGLGMMAGAWRFWWEGRRGRKGCPGDLPLTDS